jgi:hypothetical protein
MLCAQKKLKIRKKCEHHDKTKEFSKVLALFYLPVYLSSPSKNKIYRWIIAGIYHARENSQADLD